MKATGTLIPNGRYFSGRGGDGASSLCTITVGDRKFRTYDWNLWISTDGMEGKTVEVTYEHYAKKNMDFFSKITVLEKDDA